MFAMQAVCCSFIMMIWRSGKVFLKKEEGGIAVAILDDIPFDLDSDRLMKQAHVASGSDDATEFEQLIEKARRVGKPKAMFRECYIDDRGEETVTIDGITFTSRVLRANLDEPERVFVYVATCGAEMDAIETPDGDFLAQFWLDTIKASLLSNARAHLVAFLKRQYALGKIAAMSPGAGDATVWPIQQQRGLFTLLGDVKEAIGVELTDSFLMWPNKTISSFLFATEKDFQSCQLCHRDPCPGRRASFDPALWDSIAHGIEA